MTHKMTGNAMETRNSLSHSESLGYEGMVARWRAPRRYIPRSTQLPAAKVGWPNWDDVGRFLSSPPETQLLGDLLYLYIVTYQIYDNILVLSGYLFYILHCIQSNFVEKKTESTKTVFCYRTSSNS